VAFKEKVGDQCMENIDPEGKLNVKIEETEKYPVED